MGTISLNSCFNPTFAPFRTSGEWQDLNNATVESETFKGADSLLGATTAGIAWQRSARSVMTFQQPFTLETRAWAENVAIGLNIEGAATYPVSPGNFARMKHCLYLTSGATSAIVSYQGGTVSSQTYSPTTVIPWLRVTADATKLQYQYSFDSGATWTKLGIDSAIYDPLDTFRVDLCLRWGTAKSFVLFENVAHTV